MPRLNQRQRETLQQHEEEILTAARHAPRGWRVMAEIGNDGTWCGVGRVSPGTGSLLAHEGRGVAVFFDGGPFRSLREIKEQIDEAMYD